MHQKSLTKRYLKNMLNMTQLHGCMKPCHLPTCIRLTHMHATWHKLMKNTHQSKDPDQENTCSQITAATTSPYNNRHSLCAKLRLGKKNRQRGTSSKLWEASNDVCSLVWQSHQHAYPLGPIRSCVRLNALKGGRPCIPGVLSIMAYTGRVPFQASGI